MKNINKLKQWKKEVNERDNYTCQIYGERRKS